MDRMFINVRQLVREVSDREDANLPGRYAVIFHHDISARSLPYRAGMALDIFHASQAVSVLEDFEITVVMSNGTMVSPPDDYPDGQHADEGEVEKVSDEVF